jgi:hypothetical protein
MYRPLSSQIRPLPIPFLSNDYRLWWAVVITATGLSGLLILPFFQGL